MHDYGMITVTEVDVSPDLKNAKIFVTALGDKLSTKELVAALNEGAGALRHDLSRMMTSRGVPMLTFLYDNNIARAQRIDDIIDSFHKDDKDSQSN